MTQLLHPPTDLPTRDFKKRVLDNALTYSSKTLVRLDTDGYLAATFKTKQRVDPVFVVPGNFNRDKFKEVLAEAEAAGVKSDRIYVYGDSGSYSGRMITFTRLDSIPGLEDKSQAASQNKTTTPAFLDWFGQSLVTDTGQAGGVPLVVYHGTFADDFSAFRASPEGVFGAGVYFTNLPQSAEGFAGPGDADGARLIPVYLSLKNPMLVKADFEAGEAIDFDSPAVPMVQKAMGNAADLAIRTAMAGEGMFGIDLMAAVEARGHDGVIVTYEDGGKDYIAFRPEQIKSAIGNNGDFDVDNDDIRFSMPELDDETVQQEAPGP